MMKIVMFAAVAVLGACTTPAPDTIAGAWRIEDVNSGGVIDRSRLEIVFSVDGAVSGHSGCNDFSGAYTLSGEAVDIGPLASTRRACLVEALSLQEARVLASLDAAATIAFAPDGALVLAGAPPARLLLRRADDVETLRASGEILFSASALPADAVLRVVAEETGRADAPATELARTETPVAADGSPAAFSLDIPRAALPEHARVTVRAQIVSGHALLFTSTEVHQVALEGAQAPLRIQLSPVEAASGAGGRPVTPTPQAYLCGPERLRIAFEAGAAFITFEGGETHRLERQGAQQPQIPEAPRLYTNGRPTLRQEIAGSDWAVSFARGRAAFAPCSRV